MEMKDASVEDILQTSLKSQAVDFSIHEKTIFVKRGGKGYHNTTKRLNTGNVATVKGEDIQKQPVSDPVMALEGRVPGIYISQALGIPEGFEQGRL